ncbi:MULTISPECIES: NAD-dependent epimerase/dehydratase family protein [unclassified Brenneria]|uniref:NAD-dependent epimerase/dehydratase family protein n=1 Tax=unclassified Brenneria TaxID=2634434 RepID=UPI0015540799|nr:MULTISPECIES: NAD(P)-dependent oxidoreductase [unclassified Brenneria]MBJ7222052.1 NAD(P)-dependent oxidoreductase [Brenneria sp. L3-3C-1]MEE3643295.1 NAD(P)-dependent oxidoreductase [Brenneria sp. L3_3C_1]MEE3650516.1 NAD(P)-dependent oxidoreductase [Brenneria sp. HEZEL_4_2_4]NPD00471.1 NAD(P)-dependent oxidoreductase [Brenneria sp. hezel4-2-4]
MRVLITGSSGNLGTALSIKCKERGFEVIGLDKRQSEETNVIGCINNRTLVDSCMQGIDIVFHTAALHKPHIVTHSYKEFIETNTLGTYNLLQSAAMHNVKSFIFSSTTSVYGDSLSPDAYLPSSWIDENKQIESKNIYGVTKLGSEELCRIFSRNHGLNCIVFRVSRFFYEDDDNPAIRAHYCGDNAKVNELLYRRIDVEDAVNAHLCAALTYTPKNGFDRFLLSTTTPFKKEHCLLLNKNADAIVGKLFPQYREIYAALGWKLFPRIDRVYVNEKAQRVLNWRPKYTFEYALDCLSQQRSFRSPLAEKIGWHRYHDQVFENMPYPI